MATKSKVVKKTLVKKAAPAKKAAAKKATSKKVAPKKAAAKKPAVKTAIKKAAVKNPVAKKATQVKKAATPKKGVRKIAQVNPLTKPAPLVRNNKLTKSKAGQAKDSLPPATELSEELVEKAANTGNNKPVPETGDGIAASAQDPIQAFDKKVFNKATAKGDPHSKLHLSSKPKNAIKPSGKKPLW